MIREEVRSFIDNQREVQDQNWGRKLHNARYSVGDWLMYMRYWLNNTRWKAATSGKLKGPLYMLRRTASYGIACLAQHGCPQHIDDDVLSTRGREAVFDQLAKDYPYEHFGFTVEDGLGEFIERADFLLYCARNCLAARAKRGRVLKYIAEATACCLCCFEFLGCPSQGESDASQED